jgi:fatty acid desaturase
MMTSGITAALPAQDLGRARAFYVEKVGLQALESHFLQDTDAGALAASRADERQQLLSLRSRALACNLAVIAAFIGLTAAIAVKAAWWWPFLVILAIAGLGYLLGLLTYGATEADTPDDVDTGHQTRSPVNS